MKKHSLEKPAAAILATATLLAGTGLPAAALADTGDAASARPAATSPSPMPENPTVGGITLSDGTPFALRDGVWTAAYGHPLTLKDDNEPPVRNLGLSDGSKHEIAWGEPTLRDGKVVREGTASGDIRGQKWTATITAERPTDHTSLAQTITAARQAYGQNAGECTAASLEKLADAIKQAADLDATPATDEALDAMRDRLAEAVGGLDAITWKAGEATLSHEQGGGYDGKATDTSDTAPADTVALTSNDPTLGKLGSVDIHRIADDDQPTLTDEDLGVIRATGTAHYRGTLPNGGRTATWSQTSPAPASRPPAPTATTSDSPPAAATCPPPSPQASTGATSRRTRPSPSTAAPCRSPGAARYTPPRPTPPPRTPARDASRATSRSRARTGPSTGSCT